MCFVVTYRQLYIHQMKTVDIGGGYQGLGGLSPPNLQPSMDVIRNAKLHSDVPVIGCANLCNLLGYVIHVIFGAHHLHIHCFCYHVVVNRDD